MNEQTNVCNYADTIQATYTQIIQQIIQPDYTTYTGDQNLEGILYNRLYNQIIQPIQVIKISKADYTTDYTTRLYNQIIQPDYTTYTSDQNLENGIIR